MGIDIAFDFRSDTPPGKDPDTSSPTLRRYHQLLWSRRLPNGVVFELDDSTPYVYLHHRSYELGEFWLSSDAVVASDAVIPWFRKEAIMDQIPRADRERFLHLAYTIGAMMVFPGNRVDGKMTINGARGFHPRIKDRFDLTVECIRRHYLEAWSPLTDVLARYADFFCLFGDFADYVDFFHLQDLTTPDHTEVRFFAPFDNFEGSALTATLNEYLAYRDLVIDFIQARNHRIATRKADNA